MADQRTSSSASTGLASFPGGADLFGEVIERTPCHSSSCSVSTMRSSKSRGSLPKQVRFCEYTDWSYFDVEPPACLPQPIDPQIERRNSKRLSFTLRSGLSRLRRTSSTPVIAVEQIDFSHIDWSGDGEARARQRSAQDTGAMRPPTRTLSSTSLSSSVRSSSSTEHSSPRDRHSLHANIIRQPLRGTGGRVFRRADALLTRETSRPVSAAPPVRGNWDDLLSKP